MPGQFTASTLKSVTAIMMVMMMMAMLIMVMEIVKRTLIVVFPIFSMVLPSSKLTQKCDQIDFPLLIIIQNIWP